MGFQKIVVCMLFSHIQFNFENMGLFFQNEDAKYQQRGSAFWPISPTSNHLTSIQGTFNEISPNGTITTINISANDEQLFYERDHHVHFLSYYLTVLQQHFCFYRHQKVYQIKLKRKNSLTILSTTNIQIFIEFYLFLAKHCILTTFEKHYKICKPAHQLPRNTDPLKLGRGAYSIVYNGQNILSKEEVALKIFQKSSLNILPYMNKIIENEICILEKLKKYHLSPLINAYETEDCVVFVLLKAQAGNMLDYLCQHQSDYNAEFIKKIMVKILDNLKELHRAGFIHRDIKPQNILFKNSTLNSSLFLGDFGLTVPIHPTQDYENKVSKICSGTLGFIAPQIIHSNTYNEKCDIFSMGCLFYFLHKGKSLFANRTADQISRMTEDNRIIHEQIAKLDNLTTESYELMTNLLRVDPDDRPSADMLLTFQYFKNSEHQQPQTEQYDHTLRQYLLRRISRFYQK